MAPRISSGIPIFSLFIAACLAALPLPVSAAPAFSASRSDAREHVFKFYLDPALVPDIEFARTVLPKYVDDMNAILGKNTNRRLVFDPASGIIPASSAPQSNQAYSPLPTQGFEIWAHATATSHPVSYGGNAAVDASGAGVLAGLHWTRLYDPDQLSAAEVADYWTQINNMLHELAHVFGAGIGEYYKLSVIEDSTNTAPLLNININDIDDPFWSGKPDFMTDPLLRNPVQTPGLEFLSTRSALLDFVQYSSLTAAVMSGDYRNSLPMADISNITVRVLAGETSPMEGADVRIWSVIGDFPYQSQSIADALTNADGEMHFAWGGSGDPHNNYDFLRLIKVYKDGYPAAAAYVSIFDVDAAKLVNGSDTFEITIRLGEPDAPPAQVSTFSDVDAGNFAWSWIERLYDTGITGGCTSSPLAYCPDETVTRAQMAIFLERSMHGSGFIPPAASTSFGDTADHWAGAWIEALASDGISGGCGSGNYCPDLPTTRAQMAVFLLRAKFGAGYTPPPAAGTMFEDVSSDNWAAAWIEQLAGMGVTSGCGDGNFCPDSPVTRAQMAIFLVRTFDLP